MAARKGQQKASKYAERLKKMKKAWAGSKAEYEYTFGGEKVAEGVYSAQLQDLQLAESKGKRTAGQLYIRREFVISEGEFEGVPVRDMMWIENEKGPVYLRRFIEMCGFDSPPEDQPELLEDVLAKMEKDAPKVKLQVVHPANFDGLNLRVQGMDSEDDSGEIDLEDLDDMDKKELKALIKDKELDIDGYRKMGEDDLREAVKEALSSEGSGDDDDDDDDDDGDDDDDADDLDDLDEMDKKGLRALVKSEELGIDGYRKMDEDDLRSAIRLARGDEEKEEAGKDENEDDDSPDFDEMGEDELREYIEENEIDTKELGFSSKAKYKKASEDDIREALSAMNNAEDDDDNGGDEDGGELLKEAKVFCETWEVEVDEDADLDTVKEAIRGDEDEENSYPEKELDEDEVTLLEKLGLDDLIERKRKKGKK